VVLLWKAEVIGIITATTLYLLTVSFCVMSHIIWYYFYLANGKCYEWFSFCECICVVYGCLKLMVNFLECGVFLTHELIPFFGCTWSTVAIIYFMVLTLMNVCG